MNKETSNIETILSLCPATASTADSQGRKPLFQALHCKRQWLTGVQSILALDRPSLGEQDLQSSLYPFMLAASLADADRSDCIDEPPRKRQKLNSGASVSTACQDKTYKEKGARIQLTTIYHLLAEDPSVLSAAIAR